MTTIPVVLGFTQSDRENGYSSFSDGYRPSAFQFELAIEIEHDGPLAIEMLAERVFEAMNDPHAAKTGLVGEINRAIDAKRGPGVYVRTLSTGDTVTRLDTGERVACGSYSWDTVEAVESEEQK